MFYLRLIEDTSEVGAGYHTNRGSSNGRTEVFGASYLGSNPSPRTNVRNCVGMTEWLKVLVSKTNERNLRVGSNPTSDANACM